MLLPQVVYAQTSSGTGIDTMFGTFAASGTKIIDAFYGLALIIGACLSISAIYDFVKYAEDNRHGMKPAIVKTFIAVMLVSLSQSVTVSAGTIGLTQSATYKDTADLSIFGSGGSSSGAVSEFSTGALTGIIIFIKLIGHVAFIKGLLIFKDVGNNRGDATIGKGMTHLLGGAACIQLEPFLQILATTFGLSLPSIS